MPVGALQQMAAPEQGAEAQQAAPAAPQEQQRDFIAEYNEKLRRDRSVLDEQINALKSRLVERTAMPFDPGWMAVAAAAGKPTKTGHFAETAGNIASEMNKQALEQQTKGLDLMKFEQELAEKQYKLSREDANSALLNNYLQSKGLIPGGAAPAGGSAARLVGEPTGGEARAAAPSAGHRITPDEIALIGSKNKELGDFLGKLSKIQQDAVLVVDGGIYDTLGNRWIVEPSKTLERDLPKIPLGDGRTVDVGKKSVSPELVRKIEAIQNDINLTPDQRNAKLLELYDRFGFIEHQLTPSGKKQIVTPQEKAESQELTAADIKAIGTEKADQAKKYTALAENAPTLRQIGSQNLEIIQNKDVRELMDRINSSGDLKARFADLVAQGITTPGGAIAAPGYKEFVRTLGATGPQLSAFNQLIANSSQVAAMASREFLQGQGAVTENERKMIAQIGPDVYTNTPANLAFKSQVMVARAKFHEMQEQLYNQWRKDPANQRKYASEFKTSPEFKKMAKDYDDWFAATSRNYYPNLAGGAPSGGGGSLESRIRKQAE